MQRTYKIDYSKLSVYLCGPMDDSKDNGVGWRKNIIPKLLSLGFKQENIYNPCDKPKNSKGLLDEGEFGHCTALRQEGDWEELIRYTKSFMAYDLRLVDKSDIVIATINSGEKTVGSIQEIVVARNAHKPVYLIDKHAPYLTSSWLMALIGSIDRIFSSQEELIKNFEHMKTFGIFSKKDIKDFLVLYDS